MISLSLKVGIHPSIPTNRILRTASQIRSFSTNVQPLYKENAICNLVCVKNNNKKVEKFLQQNQRRTFVSASRTLLSKHQHERSKPASVPILTSIEEPADQFTTPLITVIGVGGAGGNAVNTMIEKSLAGVSFIAANTDAQALALSKASSKIQLGKKATHGLGAGSKPVVGREAAEESLEEIMRHIEGNHMIFITAGMGGGTGTGAAPVIAEAARERGILTVGIVTMPFAFEGRRRMQVAEEGINELEKVVDTLIVIPNQKLLLMGEKKTTWHSSFKLVDSVLYDGVKSVTDLIVVPGEINLDFADVRTVMKGMGRALIGSGEAEGRGRSKMAAAAALHNPLLDDVPIKGAKGVLINVHGGEDLTLSEVDEIASVVHEAVDPDANIIFGSTYDTKLNGRVKVSLIVTGMDARAATKRIHRVSLPVRHEEEDAIATDTPSGEPQPQAQPQEPVKKGGFFDAIKKYW